MCYFCAINRSCSHETGATFCGLFISIIDLTILKGVVLMHVMNWNDKNRLNLLIKERVKNGFI